jgi:aubergine-like protein
LKKDSLCKNGYVSQVVKTRSIQKKGALSVCSKILLQINAKLGGISYKTEINKEIKDRKFMVIGVDSSHNRKRTGVAMIATINDSFTDFYNKEEIIKEENKSKLQFCVSSFIEEAIAAYNKKNKELPKSIIIYRQGVSLHQKQQLKEEIIQIEEACKTKNVLFYYILVNTKTTYKFFEKDEKKKEYYNPESGLLVLDGVTNRNYFEFYIQPQEVTGGSATPTCFHVAYGNLNFPEMIPKLTFDLCHIYSNWQGTVRIPNVIKAAEKLSKMTAKYKLDELNPDLKRGQAYL